MVSALTIPLVPTPFPRWRWRTDTGTFAFEANRSGLHEVCFDVDQDGQFDGPSTTCSRARQSEAAPKLEDGTTERMPLPAGIPSAAATAAVTHSHTLGQHTDNQGTDHRDRNEDTPVEPLQMHWDDHRFVDDLLVIGYTLYPSVWKPIGTRVRRAWVQRSAENGPIVHDTWVYAEDLRTSRLSCTR